MKKTLMLLPIAALTLGACDRGCHKATEAEIAALFDRWNASLATLDPALVADNYTESAVLLATVENDPRLTREERIAYFTDFLQLRPQGVIDSRTIKIHCNKAVDAGVYTFTFGDGTRVQARFTYTYEWNGRDWKISHHHSSAMPN